MRKARVLAPAVLLLTAPLAAAAAAPGTPGSSGAGDPYFPLYGNGGYDVVHYDIHASFDPATEQLEGDTTVHATATQDLSQLNLDLTIPATSVTVDGTVATFTQDAHELVVTPATTIASGTDFAVEVVYAGKPATYVNGTLGGWFTTGDGAIAAGEPEASVFWYPANDHPSDKATFDLYLSAPSAKQVISNGILKGRQTTGSLTRWHWQVNQPMATYLATADIGDYQIVKGVTPDGTPYLYGITEHMGKQLRASAVASLRKTPAVVDFYSKIFGAYPFDTTGGILANATFGFSLENQTRPNYSKVFFGSGVVNSEVIAHELAHMWWGDSVSVSQWRDIWLNEGFATWSAWQWAKEESHGQVKPNEVFRLYYNQFKPYPNFWTVEPGNPGSNNVFDGAVYMRGGLALQALRNKIGAADHAKLLRTWARTHRWGNGSVAEFEALAEKVSGKQLDTFFAEWLHQSNRPKPSKALGFPASMLGRPVVGGSARAAVDPASRAFVAQQLRNRELAGR